MAALEVPRFANRQFPDGIALQEALTTSMTTVLGRSVHSDQIKKIAELAAGSFANKKVSIEAIKEGSTAAVCLALKTPKLRTRDEVTLAQSLYGALDQIAKRVVA